MDRVSTRIGRRALLAGSVSILALSGGKAFAAKIVGKMPWEPDAGSPPKRVTPGGWLFFTPQEAAAIEALVDRVIPPDPATPGGKDAGCAVFIDRQLAGPYGRASALYMRPPFAEGTAQQGAQSSLTPAARYRQGLAALEKHVAANLGGKALRDLSGEQLDDLLKGMEAGTLKLPETDAKAFFAQLLQNTKEGFFADPIYGGNRDMAGWKMIGFPGAHYDFSDWVGRHNEHYPLPPVSIAGR